ncbi:hypothetical protein IFO70_06115 [Phormidium tenue FACHB-886]|nr:hypothetical protein [Phormidium tenue FACHB-886]
MSSKNFRHVIFSLSIAAVAIGLSELPVKAEAESPLSNSSTALGAEPIERSAAPLSVETGEVAGAVFLPELAQAAPQQAEGEFSLAQSITQTPTEPRPSTPYETNPDTNPAATSPRPAAPATPGASMPDTTTPGTTSPGTLSQDTTTPRPPRPTNSPGEDNPETNPSATPDPDTTTPGNSRPGTTSPGTTSPGTTTPGTSRPGTTSPGTTSPGTFPQDTTTPRPPRPTNSPGEDNPETNPSVTPDSDTTTPGNSRPGTTTPGNTTPNNTTPDTDTTPDDTTTPDEPGVDRTPPGTFTPDTSDVSPGRATRSGSSYIGVGGSIGLGDGDTALGESSFSVFSKVGLTSNISARPAVLISDDPTILLPLTLDFTPFITGATEDLTSEIGRRVSPYLGAGVAISTGDDSTVDFLATAGLDVALTSEFTATAAVNATLFDNPAVGLLLGVGFNF